MNEQKKGAFIAFEGIDGSGKSTQIKRLEKRLRQQNTACYTTMEPTDSPIGSMIHNIMVGRMKVDNKVFAALFTADRLDHLLNDVNGLLAKLEEGTTVLSDRYYFSSYAYQSVDLTMEQVIAANEPCARLLRPAVNIFLDIDADTAMERITKNRSHVELFEKKSRLEKTRTAYMEAFERLKDEENVVVIDGTKSPDEIEEEIWAAVVPYVEQV